MVVESCRYHLPGSENSASEIKDLRKRIEEQLRLDEIVREELRENFRTCQKCGSKNIEFVGFVKVCNDCGEGVYDLIEQPKLYDELDRMIGTGMQIPERMLK